MQRRLKVAAIVAKTEFYFVQRGAQQQCCQTSFFLFFVFFVGDFFFSIYLVLFSFQIITNTITIDIKDKEKLQR